MADTLVAVTDITKKFGDFTAVDGLSFTVGQGEVYGFLGQNGAGKSTTMRMLLSLIQPTGGSIRLLGKNLLTHRTEILQQVGAIIERPDLYTYLTAIENLRMMARLSGAATDAKSLMQQLERVGLAQRAVSKVKTFSQGMKQRLGLACALTHNPQLLILDEPANGLDPQGIADMRNLILHLSKEEGKTILISSHLLSEVELVADSMLIIDRGKKVAEGSVKDLLNPADTLVLVHTTADAAARLWLQESGWGNHLLTGGKDIRLRLHQRSIPELNRQLVQQGFEVLSLQSRHSLEDYFLSLTTPNQHVAAYADRAI